MSTLEVPDIMKFKALVSAIPDTRDRTLIETVYLTASREAELCQKVTPWDLQHTKTKPYGLYLKYEIQNFEVTPAKSDKPAVNEKVLLLTIACAKRGKKNKKQKQGEPEKPKKPERPLTTQEIADLLPERFRQRYLQDPANVDPFLVQALAHKMTYKKIALPCNPKYEPWTVDLLHYIQKHGTVSFNLCRKTLWEIQRQYLEPFLPRKNKASVKNPLRHFRITHLLDNYNFQADEITTYSGWSLKTTFNQMGVLASPNLDIYSHLAWRKYFPKLLRELL